MRFKNADFESAEEVIYQFHSFLWTKLLFLLPVLLLFPNSPHGGLAIKFVLRKCVTLNLGDICVTVDHYAI